MSKVIDTITEKELDNLTNFLRNISLNTDKMSTEQLNVLINSLKLPDCVKDLPAYSGNKSGLHDFITNVTEIIEQCEHILGKDKVPTTFLRAIRNKIHGEADEVLTMYGTKLNWETIKSNLINHYADKRNETSLVKDLHLIYQGSDSIEKFFSRIIEIQSALISHAKLHEQSPVVRAAKEAFFTDMCLNVFLAGIREPLGSMIRARNPMDIAEAYNLCAKEQNMYYIKHKSQQSSNPPNYNINKRPITNLTPRYLNPQVFQNQFRDSPQQNRYYNHQPFRQSSVPFRNNFQPNYQNKPMILPPKPAYRQEPMDTSSNMDKIKQYTVRQTINDPQRSYQHQNNIPRYNFNQQGPPRVKVQELYNIEKLDPGKLEEIMSDDMNSYDQYYNGEPHSSSLEYPYESEPEELESPNVVDDTDFREHASPNPSVS